MSLHMTIFFRSCTLVIVSLLLLGTEALAWERGNHAGSWTKGATIHVFVDPIPADAPAGVADALTEAIKEWNEAQSAFGGLTLTTTGADKTNSEIHISWGKNLAAWGSVAAVKGADPGFTKTTTKVSVEINDGLDSRGITRILKHELGHAEGLGHSALSALMKADAYSSTPGKAPTSADLNSTDPFTGPTDDDKAGKKALWGTTKKLSQSTATSNPFWDGLLWNYKYTLTALTGLDLTDPVTAFTLDLPLGIFESDFTVGMLPTSWDYDFFEGYVDPFYKSLDLDEEASPSLLNFFATSPGDGIYPGDQLDFYLTSLLGPADTRAFTNSPSYDSDEFVLQAPSTIPEPGTLVLCLIGTLGLVLLRWKPQRSEGDHLS